jgi:DNA-binding LytR/AlgR family response regulator
LKVIIIDDEPRAIDLLKGYLQHFSDMELVATFRNGLKAFEYISKYEVDLVFLDINMPHISGLSLSKMLGDQVKIIFTTAYSEYAVESYDVQAVDYLLKPISLARFTKAISKLITTSETSINLNNDGLIYVKSGSEIFRLKPSEILYIEKDGNYSTYCLSGRKIVSRESISEFLSHLPSNFIQVHKSYIVNSNRVFSVQKDSILIDDVSVPIGDSFKQRVKAVLLNG